MISNDDHRSAASSAAYSDEDGGLRGTGAGDCGLDARRLSPYAVARPERPGLVIGYGHQGPEALAGAVARLARSGPY